MRVKSPEPPIPDVYKRQVQSTVLGSKFVIYLAMYRIGKHRVALAKPEDERVEIVVFQ